MEPEVIQPLLEVSTCCGWSLKDLLIFTALFAVIIVILKAYFRGGQFNVPEIDLTGKYAIVTGGNSGIGAETAKELCRLGCEVIIGARNKETAEEVIKTIRKATPSAKVEYIPLDLASRSSISSFAASVNFPHIDYLVNNAGVMAIPNKKATK